MAKFEVGEIAILIMTEAGPCNLEVEIMSGLMPPLSLRGGGFKNGNPAYQIRGAGGIEGFAVEKDLRKKPKDEGARDWFNKNIRIKDEVSTV